MTLYDSIILGVVEGITEYLPVSSTAHLVLTAQLLEIEQTDFLKSFEIIIQLAPIFSVIFLFWSRLFASKDLWFKLGVSFFPTGVVGFLFHDYIEAMFIVDTTIVLMFLTGIAFLLIERYRKEPKIHSEDNISYKRAFIIGLFQTLSLIPGVSRSGSTILGAMLLKIDRELAMRYSFLLAVPTMGIASGYVILRDYQNFELANWELLSVGFIVSFLVGIVAIKGFLHIVSKYSFRPFGWYLIISALVFLIFDFI